MLYSDSSFWIIKLPLLLKLDPCLPHSTNCHTGKERDLSIPQTQNDTQAQVNNYIMEILEKSFMQLSTVSHSYILF